MYHAKLYATLGFTLINVQVYPQVVLFPGSTGGFLLWLPARWVHVFSGDHQQNYITITPVNDFDIWDPFHWHE